MDVGCLGCVRIGWANGCMLLATQSPLSRLGRPRAVAIHLTEVIAAKDMGPGNCPGTCLLPDRAGLVVRASSTTGGPGNTRFGGSDGICLPNCQTDNELAQTMDDAVGSTALFHRPGDPAFGGTFDGAFRVPGVGV